MLDLIDRKLSMCVIGMHELLSLVNVKHVGNGCHVLVLERWNSALGVTSILVELAID